MNRERQELDSYTKKSAIKKKIDWNDYHLESEYLYPDKKSWQKRKYRHKNGKDKICLCGHYEGKKWKVGIPEGMEKPLYRLPELLASKRKTVFVCEGEKDTDNLRAWEYIAVCSPFGAKHWDKRYNQLFIGKKVYLVPDNDPDGKLFTQKVGKNLLAVALSVQVIRIPKEYKDFTEWKEAKGNDKDKFKKLKVEKWRSEKKKEKKKEESKKKEFSPSLYAKKILAKYKVIYDQNKRLWFYDQEEGIWKDNFEPLCRSILRKGLLAEFDTIYFENETIEALKDLSYQEKIPPEPARTFIPFKNGIYDLKEDKLRPFESSFFFINKLAIKFNPQPGQYPNIDKLFFEIVDKKDVITLYEMIAYAMYRGYPYPKAFIVWGNGANGKSTYCQVLRRIIGNENISSISLNTLQYNTFGTAGLYGKLLNISPEMSYNILKKTDILKQLTGGDLVRGEKKFKEPFQFINYAKLIFIGNEIPFSVDKSFAFYRRMFLVEFPRRFEIKLKADPFIVEKIPEEEFEALGFESIQVLRELEKNKFTFTRHKRTKKIEEEYERLSDPLGAFLEEKTEDDPERDIPVKNFNVEFKKFQREKGLRQWTDKLISKVMRDKGYIKRSKNLSTSVKGQYLTYKAYLELKWKILEKIENDEEANQ